MIGQAASREELVGASWGRQLLSTAGAIDWEEARSRPRACLSRANQHTFSISIFSLSFIWDFRWLLALVPSAIFQTRNVGLHRDVYPVANLIRMW